MSRRAWRLRETLALCACGLLAASCWNGGIHGSTIYEGGTSRFQLVIESNRSDVDASHFLVDSYTGDTWRLDVAGGGGRGTWVRLADAPLDAADLEADEEEEAQAQAQASGAG